MSTAENLEMSIFGIGVEVAHIAQHTESLDIDKTIQLVQLAEKILNLAKANPKLNVLVN